MNKKNINILAEIFSELFNTDLADFNDSLSRDQILEWDSIGTVKLINELESNFNVEFDILEISNLHSVGIIKSVLTEKGVNFD